MPLLHPQPDYDFYAVAYTLAEFKARIIQAIADGEQSMLDDLLNNFKVGDDGAFKILHAPTHTTTEEAG